MIPIQKTDHVTTAMGKLISQYKDYKPVMHGIAKANLQPLQTLEDVTWDVMRLRFLHPLPGRTDSAAGNQLDVLGSLLGCPRNGLADVDYVAALDVQILVNVSQGRPDDILGILNAALGGPSAYAFSEQWYNTFFVQASNITKVQAATLLRALNLARAMGYRALFRYSNTTPNQDFLWADSHTGVAQTGQNGFGYIPVGATAAVGGGLPYSTQG